MDHHFSAINTLCWYHWQFTLQPLLCDVLKYRTFHLRYTNVHNAVSTSGAETKISKSNPGIIMLASRAFAWWVGFTRDLSWYCCISGSVKAVNTDQRPAGREIQGLEHNPALDTGCICSKSSKFYYARNHTNGVWDANFLLTLTVAQWTLCSTQHSHVSHTIAPSQTPVLAVHEGQGLEREMTLQTPAIQTRNTASHSPLICCYHNTIHLVPLRQFMLSQTFTSDGFNPTFTIGGFVDLTQCSPLVDLIQCSPLVDLWI